MRKADSETIRDIVMRHQIKPERWERRFSFAEIDSDISVLRNPDIAHALYLRGLIEKAKRGSVLMIQQCQENGLPAPVWHSDPALGVTVIFNAPEATPQATPEVTPEVKRLLQYLKGEMNRQALQDAMGLKDAEHFRKSYLLPALAVGVIEMTIPDKPGSSNTDEVPSASRC